MWSDRLVERDAYSGPPLLKALDEIRTGSQAQEMRDESSLGIYALAQPSTRVAHRYSSGSANAP
jgi:hypothetical protein